MTLLGCQSLLHQVVLSDWGNARTTAVAVAKAKGSQSLLHQVVLSDAHKFALGVKTAWSKSQSLLHQVVLSDLLSPTINHQGLD